MKVGSTRCRARGVMDERARSRPSRAPRRWQIKHADCLKALPKLDADSVDAVITDPPYGLNFMGKDWDRPMVGHVPQSGRRPVSDETGRHDEGYRNMRGYERQMQAWHEAWAREALRVLKPGGHLLAFGGTRTFHRLTCALEDAGFEIRDCLCWLYGQGFPKSLNVAVAIDKADGHPPRGRAIPVASTHLPSGRYDTQKLIPNPVERYRPRSRAAASWQGWGTALKPGWEPIILARKPLDGTVAQNVRLHGTGALNIDGCRIGFRDQADERSSKTKNRHADFGSKARKSRVYGRDERSRSDQGNYDAPGRWPAGKRNPLAHPGLPARRPRPRAIKRSSPGAPRQRRPGHKRSQGSARARRALKRRGARRLLGVLPGLSRAVTR